VHIECCQAVQQRLTRPADLLELRRYLVIAQVRVVAAGRADDLIPACIAAVSMAVDHAHRLRPENRGPVVVPGDSMPDRHAAIVPREPDTSADRQMNFRWLSGYMTSGIRRQRVRVFSGSHPGACGRGVGKPVDKRRQMRITASSLWIPL
jgi:hypothetical protein